MSVQGKIISGAVAIFIMLSATALYWRMNRVILDIPALLGQPIYIVERHCGVAQKIKVDDSGSETRWYDKPLECTINYDATGKAASFYIGPHAAYRMGMRFSNARRWIKRFGFSSLPVPEQPSSTLLTWRHWRGLNISVELATSGDWGVDVGGDSDDVELMVRFVR